MNREECLDWLCRLRSEIYVYMPKEWIIPMNNALDMVIKELDQRPCTDAISRQDAIRVASGYCHWSNIPTELAKLPSVNPKPCGDAISRQAALDAFGLSEKTRKYGGDHSGYNTMMMYEIQDVIEGLSPATPQPKTGRWRHYEGMLICSKCGAEFYDDIMEYCGDDVPKCCPDCGAKMEVEE